MITFILLSGCNDHEASLARPNILFCLADDASWKHFEAYGCKWVKTPGFDEIAARGLLFNNAYTPTAKCAPSRSAILTGRNPWQLEEAANHICYFPKKFTTIAEALSSSGYHVGYTGKGWAPGNAGKIDGKKRDLIVEAYNERKLNPPTKEISNKDYAANFKLFLEKKETGQPFFFWYGGHEPHRRYEYKSGIEKGGASPEMIEGVPEFWPDTDTVRTDMLDYAYEIQYFDHQLEQILEILKTAGELENTLIVVTADNGMPFPRAKGHNYEYSNHLPLAIMWESGINKPGRVIDDYVTFIDFAATFADVSGLDIDEQGMYPIEGESLDDIFKSKKSGQVVPGRNKVILGRERNDVGRPGDVGYPVRAIIKNGFLYIRNFKTDRWPAGNPETGYTDTDGSPTKSYILNLRRRGEDTYYWKLNFGKRPAEELYDLNNDPDCTVNLADEPEYDTMQQELSDLLIEELTRQQDPRILGNGDIFDSYPTTSINNFYEKYMEGEEVHAGWINSTDYEQDTAYWKE